VPTAERASARLCGQRYPAHFARVTVDPEAGTVIWSDGSDLAPDRYTRQRGETTIPGRELR
jgi:hypothetical protein